MSWAARAFLEEFFRFREEIRGIGRRTHDSHQVALLEVVLRAEEMAVGLEPFVDVLDRLVLDLGLSDGQCHGLRPDPLDSGLDPFTKGEVGRAEEERGNTEVGQGEPSAAGHAVIRFSLEEPCVAGADLQRLGSRRQDRVERQLVVRQLGGNPLGSSAEVGKEEEHAPVLVQEDRRGDQAGLTRFFPDQWHTPLIHIGGGRARQGIRVEDVVGLELLQVAGQDRLTEIDLGIQQSQLDQEGLAGGPRQVGIAAEREAAVARRQGHVGHEPDLLRLDRWDAPVWRRVLAPDIPNHFRRSHRWNPGPEQGFQVGSHCQVLALIQVSQAVHHRLGCAPDRRLDADDIEV